MKYKDKVDSQHQLKLQFEPITEPAEISPSAKVFSFTDFKSQKSKDDTGRLAFERLVSHAEDLTW